MFRRRWSVVRYPHRALIKPTLQSCTNTHHRAVVGDNAARGVMTRRVVLVHGTYNRVRRRQIAPAWLMYSEGRMYTDCWFQWATSVGLAIKTCTSPPLVDGRVPRPYHANHFRRVASVTFTLQN